MVESSLFEVSSALAKNCIGNPFLYYITIVSVVGFWLSISLLIEKTHMQLRLLPFIGQNTLLILCTHMPTFGIIKGIALICHVSLDFFESTGGCLCLWIGSFVILLPAAYVLNRFCPVLVGKKRISLWWVSWTLRGFWLGWRRRWSRMWRSSRAVFVRRAFAYRGAQPR